jgi:excisionase family DNA binding protein
MSKISQDLAEIKQAITNNKRVLNFEEACQYLGYSSSYLYKLTSAGIVPFSKPNGKKIFFDRELLDSWLLGNASPGKEKREVTVSNYITTHQ